jgi:predicted outer membrane repeat protein
VNFREFEELLRSAEKEINLMEDVTIDESEYDVYEMGIDITCNIVINGNGHAVDGKGKASLFYIEDSSITLKDIILRNGCSEYKGGAIFSKGSLTIEECRFTGNSSDEYGGAVYSSSRLSIKGCVFEKNRADYGGAVFNDSDSTIEKTQFISNTSEFEGGAVYNKKSLSIDGCSFSGNASFKGGAIYNKGVSKIRNSEFEGNIASDGNHIEIEDENCLEVSDSIFRD